MTKKLFVSALALCAFTISMSAQNAPTAPAKAPVKTEAKVKKAATTTSATTGAKTKTTTPATTDAAATVKKPMNHKKEVKAKKAEKAGTN